MLIFTSFLFRPTAANKIPLPAQVCIHLAVNMSQRIQEPACTSYMVLQLVGLIGPGNRFADGRSNDRVEILARVAGASKRKYGPTHADTRNMHAEDPFQKLNLDAKETEGRELAES
jgi:hypothetical protein